MFERLFITQVATQQSPLASGALRLLAASHHTQTLLFVPQRRWTAEFRVILRRWQSKGKCSQP